MSKSNPLTGKTASHDHHMRVAMTDELHARPFAKLQAPCRIAFIALKPDEDGIHDQVLAHRQLLDFLKIFRADQTVKAEAVHHFTTLFEKEDESLTLKWENHNEFATYTLYSSDMRAEPFAPDLHDYFDENWIRAYPGRRITSAVLQVEIEPDVMAIEHRVNTDLRSWFLHEGFAAGWVSDHMAVLAGNFHLDQEGHIRFALLGRKGIGPRRLGRIIQRILEIEVYKSMAMLTLPMARDVMAELNTINRDLADTVETMAKDDNNHKQTLQHLQSLSARIALLDTQTATRFAAARAYERLVNDRTRILREGRVLGRQLFAEFMVRRFDPAMRTCHAASDALQNASDRADKATDLLGTRVSVTTAEQNRTLLHKMDKRAEQQARLQETVEGISVVAISYYAVSLLTYLLAPITKVMPINKTILAALLVIPVVTLVWISMHRLKEKLIRKNDKSLPQSETMEQDLTDRKDQ
ncbi:MAG: DUF3422 domain-containing protein [Cohaesibacter sp.]|nr:DUF3422 domain-containing protein [Cohaesibacter sp.]MCV6600465.1 DUF3422 domain-containing protein [Cohaesibacter sp.]